MPGCTCKMQQMFWNLEQLNHGWPSVSGHALLTLLCLSAQLRTSHLSRHVIQSLPLGAWANAVLLCAGLPAASTVATG